MSSLRSLSLLHLLATLLLVVLWWLFTQTTLSIRPDDAFIYYSYIKNIHLGSGLVFQDGPPVNACSSTLYPLTVALFSFPFSIESIPLVGHWVGMSALLLVLFLCLFLSQRHPKHTIAILLFPFILLSHRLIYAGVGMETFLLLLVLLLTTVTYLSNKLTLATILAALAVLVRPDSLVLIGLLGLDYLYRERKLPPWKYPLLFLAVLSPWYFSHWLTYGEVFPQTLAAKLAQSEAKDAFRGELFLSRALGRLTPFESLPLNATFLGILLLGCIPARKNRLASLMVLWGILYVASYAFFLNAPGYKWYYTPLLLPLGILLSLGLEFLINTVQENKYIHTTICIALLGLLFTYAILGLPHKQDVHRTKWFRYKQVAQWMNQHAEPNSSLASPEIGILRYYYEKGLIIDTLGLVTPEAVPFVRERKISEFIKQTKPDYILTDKPYRKIREAFVREPWFQREYRSIPEATKGIRGRLFHRSSVAN